MVHWKPYLESLCNTYAQWWRIYTITDVVGRKREERGKREEKIERLTVLEGLHKYASEHVLLVGRPGSGKSTALIRLVLEEAKAALTPLPPSPKMGEGGEIFSNSLAPLSPSGRGVGGEGKIPVFKEGEITSDSLTLAPLSPSGRGAGGEGKIPVLVELRYYRTSILDLIQDFLQRHDPNLTVDAETLKTWLRQGQLLLLVDGLNELPSEEARRELQKFRQDYQKTTPMIFTTRDLGVGGDLDIAKKLEMQPLSEAQMQQFVRAYLPQQGEQMLRQLGSRLREFGQTPLLLLMLCSLFNAMGKVPPNLGLVFRQFAQSYYDQLKQDVPVTEESRDWCQLLLEQLAFRMTQGREKTQLQVAISKPEAEEILTAFLRDEGLEQPRNRALKWLKDLLKHHLIQLGAGNQIEFRHQLIQEYYTAEYLLKVLAPLAPQFWGEPESQSPPKLGSQCGLGVSPSGAPGVDLGGEKDLRVHRSQFWGEQDQTSSVFPPKVGGVRGGNSLNLGGISDDELKREYLNYLKWTEPIALMLELVEDEVQAVRVVRLALEVDLRLGARLAGAVKPEWQEQTVGLVAGLEISQLLKIQLLNLTKSEKATRELAKALNDEDSDVRWSAAEALGKIGSDAAIQELVNALNDEDYDVRSSAAEALGKIGSDAAIQELVNALNDEDSDVRSSAAEALGKIGSDAAIQELVKTLDNEDYDVRSRAAKALGKIGSDAAIPGVVKALNDEDFDVRWSAAEALGKIGSDAAIQELFKALKNKDSYSSVRSSVAEALGNIGSDAAIQELVKALNDEDFDVRSSVAKALGNIGSDDTIPELVKALNDAYFDVRIKAASALGRIGSYVAINELAKALNDTSFNVRWNAAHALGKIGSDAAINELVKVLNDEDSDIRWFAAEALGKIASNATIPELVKALDDEDYKVRSSAAYALGKIGSDAAIDELVKALNDEDSDVRKSVAKALGKIGSNATIPELVKALDDEDYFVRSSAAYALREIGSDAAIPELIKALNNEYSDVRRIAADTLGKIGSDAAIHELAKALNDENSDVRWFAAEALGEIGSDAAIHELAKALNDENSDVRWFAAEALGKIGSDAAINELVNALNDEVSDVRWSAAEALGEIATSELLPDLSERLKTAKGTHLLYTISAIQERCKFYNYILTQPSLS